MLGDHEEREVTISGVKVVFPCKPYPSQFGMMDRVIKGLDRRQNCLLESPTGSGKSLALLCSALAWQNSQHLKLAKESMSPAASSAIGKNEGGSCRSCQCQSNVTRKDLCNTETNVEANQSQDPVIVLDDDDDDDFKVPTKFNTPLIGQKKQKKRSHVSISYDDGDPKKSCGTCTCQKESPTTASSKEKVPKIYFGTRTHKQIAQIVRELGKTAYHDVRMVILASREYTCVHPEVVKLKNKSEGCRDRLDVHGPGCTYNERAKRVFLNQGHLQNEMNSAWDLEDLVHACKKKKACPYFVTRNIKDQADIVFCPYNYLIDPLVRKSMDINLKDQVIILDEAHNIEDCARDAAGGKITTQQITQTIHNLQELLDANVKFSDHLTLKRMMENVLTFVEDNRNRLDQSDYDTSWKVWSGFDMVARLKNIGLGPDTITEYKTCLDNISASDDDQQQNTMRNFRGMEIKLQSSSLKILELLLQILDYMYRDQLKFVEDYRVAIMKSIEYVAARNTNDSWLGRNRRGKTREEVFTINFWCMNPAVAFSDFNPCRNVVLSSGTLSPMTSFASELGVPFPIQLEANHVIKDDQVWVGSVGSGPTGSQLQAVYKNMETFTFQDELGNFILQVCQKVPHGVLCFLPSYRALEKFTERWKLTRVWEKLSTHKKIHVEPRAADREDFDYMMKQFYAVVKDPSCCDDDDYDCEDTSERTGAVFFAVCRGKVSEGMDFADNNARAVITVGIPFPSIKDLQVKLKREYNDKYRTERGLLSGNEWYEIQAFRALNQALGRCIRHRKDWGAIIIVDDRFVRMAAKYNKGLSKWVRNKVRTFEEYPRFLDSVSKFTDKMEKEMPVINPDTSFIPCTPSTPAAGSRRRSVYNQNSTYSVTSPQEDALASPYFMNSNGSSPQFMNTPDRYIKPGTSKSTCNSPESSMVKSNLPSIDPNLTTVMASAIPGVPIYTQLVNIMNSVAVPKDKPYCIILNKGLPDEQMFHVDPSKTSQQEVGKALPTVGTAQTAQSLLTGRLLPAIGTASTAQLAVDAPKTSAAVASTIGSTHGQPQANGPGNKAANSTNQQLKTFEVNGVPNQPIHEQLKLILSSPSLPKDESYYIVFNKGRPDAQTLLIEPNKNVKKEKKQYPGTINLKTEENTTKSEPHIETKVNTPKQINTITNIESQLNISTSTDMKINNLINDSKSTDTVKKNEVQQLNILESLNKTTKIKIEPQLNQLNASKPIEGESNKFLKFCNLPKPVINMEPEKKDERTLSPVLFENCSDETVVNNGDINLPTESLSAQAEVAEAPEQADLTASRKPIFKKGVKSVRNLEVLRKDDNLNTSVREDADINDPLAEAIRNKTVENLAKENKRLSNKRTKDMMIEKVDEKNKNTTNISEVTEDKSGAKGTKSLDISKHDRKERTANVKDVAATEDQSVPTRKRISRGKFDRSVLDKLKSYRRLSLDKQKELNSETTRTNAAESDILHDVSNVMIVDDDQTVTETDGHSDEEFLCTRRKSGRKRSSTGTNKQSTKRQKGVLYENETSSTKENKNVKKSSLHCAKCGNVLVTSTDFTRRKDCPTFIQKSCSQKQEEIVDVNISDLGETSLQVLTQPTNKGPVLDCHYIAEKKCCVQYLQCKHCTCKDQYVVGARVIMTETQSDAQIGQSWLLSSAVKT